MFDRVLKMLLTGNVLTHLIRYYLLKVSGTTSGWGSKKYFFWLNCLEYEQVNTSWLVITDLEKILFSVSVWFKTKVTTYLARLTAGMWLRYIYNTRTWYRVSCKPNQSWNGKENSVSSSLRSPENAIPKARKICYSK